MAVVSPGKTEDGAHFAWQLVDKLDEQRRYPRVELDLLVAFRNASGQHCAARLLNIAPDGIQVRCNVATAQILHPGGGKICPRNAPIVESAIAIPLASGRATLSVCSRLTYLTTVPDEPRCVIGLQFLDPRPKAQRVIDQFFGEILHEYFAVDECSGVHATV